MELRVGWATEFGRQKFDISVNDVDLETLYREQGISPAHAVHITNPHKFQLLLTLANWYSALEAARIAPAVTQEQIDARELLKQQAARARQDHQATIARVRQDLGLDQKPDEQPAAAPGN